MSTVSTVYDSSRIVEPETDIKYLEGLDTYLSISMYLNDSVFCTDNKILEETIDKYREKYDDLVVFSTDSYPTYGVCWEGSSVAIYDITIQRQDATTMKFTALFSCHNVIMPYMLHDQIAQYLRSYDTLRQD